MKLFLRFLNSLLFPIFVVGNIALLAVAAIVDYFERRFKSP